MTDYEPPTCNWREDADGVWSSDCGDAFVFDDSGTPEEHHFTHCPYCGRRIKGHAHMFVEEA